MKTNLEKARQAFAENWTEKRVKNNLNEDAQLMWVKMKQRRPLKSCKVYEISTKIFTDRLIIKKLEEIAKAMPTEGYGMGGSYSVRFSKLEGIYNNCDSYAHSCRFKPTWGGYTTKLTLDELINIKVIGGLVAYVHPNQKSKVKKCYWYDSKGLKQYFQLIKVDGYICNDFHALTKDAARAGAKRIEQMQKERAERFQAQQKQKEATAKMFIKALRLQYTFQDSLNCGNCEVGTKAFILRCGLSSEKKYRGAYLLKVAREKSTSSFSFVERMINHKIK